MEITYTTFEVNNFQGTIANLEFTKPQTKREAENFLASLNWETNADQSKYSMFLLEGLLSTTPGIKDCVALDSPVSSWFELTYAQYLTIPRSVLEAMPLEWQERFARCLKELDEEIDWRPQNGQQYRVALHKPEEIWTDRGKKIEWGEEMDDRFANYRYPVEMPFIKNDLSEVGHG